MHFVSALLLSLFLSAFFSLHFILISWGEYRGLGSSTTPGGGQVCLRKCGGSLERRQGIVRGVCVWVCDTYQDHSPIWLYSLHQQGSLRPFTQTLGQTSMRNLSSSGEKDESVAPLSHFSFLDAMYYSFGTFFFSIQGLIQVFVICYCCFLFAIRCLWYSVVINRLLFASVCAANWQNSPSLIAVMRCAIMETGVSWICCQKPLLGHVSLLMLLRLSKPLPPPAPPCAPVNDVTMENSQWDQSSINRRWLDGDPL